MNIHSDRRLFVTAMLAGLATSIRAEPTAQLSIAIVPQFKAEDIFTSWSPVLRELEVLSGIKARLQFYPNIPEFEKAFLQGIPDVAYMNPYHALMGREKQGYVPIIRDKSAPLEGILVVRQDSPIERIEELAGSTLAFPSPNAFGASLYMRALLAQNHKLNFTPVYVQTHANAYRQVITGKAAAAGGIQATLMLEDPAIQRQLRVLYKTPPTPSHPVVVHPRVPLRVRTALQQAFLALAGKADGRTLLKQIQLEQASKASFDDYAPLQKLDLDKYSSQSSQ